MAVETLRARAAQYGVGEVVDVMSAPGGGTLPGVEIPSAGVRLAGDHRDALRRLDHPIIARMEDDHTVIDLRTVHPDDDIVVADALRAIG